MKQLKDYTLGEVQDICNGRNRECKNKDDECLFCKDHTNRFCKVHSNSPIDWKLKERKHFSDDQLAVMRVFYKLGFRFIAEDANDDLYFYATNPTKADTVWINGGKNSNIAHAAFQQITWDDENAICIADYINADS